MLYQKSSTGYAYYQNDHLGTPQQLVQKSGAKVWGGEYRAFGELVAEEGSWGNRLRFPGQYYDEETNNYYNYKRDYDPSTGRYLESDPLGLAGGINTYLYANANPLSWIDPDGEMAGAVGFGVIVTVGVVTVSAIIVNSQNSWVSPVDDTGPDPMDPDYSPDQCPPEDDDGCKKEMSVCHPICAGNCVAIAGGGNACYRRCMRTCLPAHCADNY